MSFGITVFLHPNKSLFAAVSIIALQFSLLSYTVLFSSTVIWLKPEHPEKPYAPMLVTLAEIVILVKDLQPLKALLPILVTAFGIIISDKLAQPKKAASSIFVTLSGMFIFSNFLQL